MDKYAIRQEINNLQRENIKVRSKISQCERTITKLNDIYEKLNESLQQINNAEHYLQTNIINNKVADKGHASDSIANIEKAKGKIDNLISKIRNKINSYNSEINQNENRIANLRMQLQNMD